MEAWSFFFVGDGGENSGPSFQLLLAPPSSGSLSPLHHHHSSSAFYPVIFKFVSPCCSHPCTHNEPSRKQRKEKKKAASASPSRKRKKTLDLAVSLSPPSFHAFTGAAPNFSSRAPIVVLLGLSIGRPSALLQTPWLSTPIALETPKRTV